MVGGLRTYGLMEEIVQKRFSVFTHSYFHYPRRFASFGAEIIFVNFPQSLAERKVFS